jgi:hypothetical protein
MVKKANFANNFAKELGGEIYDLEQYKDGGGIPERYRNMGFSKVGAKKQSTREGKKWMVLAKKGDQYKVVHGGWEGMKDFKQHGSEKRRERFWDRMGGKDSAKAKDPFSPLYWHKRFGTWKEGGETPDMFDYENFKEGDFRTDITTSNTLANLKNTNLNKGLIAANTLGDPRNMMWALPDRGFLGALKGVAGATAGLSGTALGYQKMFSGKNKNTDSYIENTNIHKISFKYYDYGDKLFNVWHYPIYKDNYSFIAYHTFHIAINLSQEQKIIHMVKTLMRTKHV